MVTTKVEQTERMDSWYRNVFQWTGIVRETLGAEHWDSAIHKAPGVRITVHVNAFMFPCASYRRYRRLFRL